MRKLVLQMQMSVDGFVTGPNGQLDWMTYGMDAKHLQILTDLTNGMDTILMGRKMVNEFCTYWEGVVDNHPENPEYTYAKIFVDTPKIIFSKTINQVNGRNTRVESGDLTEVVNKLKKQEGKNLIVYGGANFVYNLLASHLVDDLFLFTHPVAIVDGAKIFSERFKMKLLESTGGDNGIVVNHYQPLP